MKNFVAEITVVVDSIGTEQTFLFGTAGFTTRPSDTPANAYVAARLKNAGTMRRELFSGTRVTGAVRPSFGELVLINADGGLDAWMGYGISGGKVVVRMGEEGAAYPAGYTTVYIAYAQHIVSDFREIRVRLRDRLNLLERPLVTGSFGGSGGLEGTTGMAGKLKQWVSSDPGYFPPILVDAALQLYFVQSTGTGGIGSLFSLYEGGVPITRDANYTSASDCLSTSPSAGECRFWLGSGGNGPVYVRLGSVPKFDLRVFSGGYQSNGSSWSLPAMAALAGITGGTGALVVGAQLVDDSRSILQVMQDACISAFGWFGMTRLDVFRCGTLSEPDASTVHNFNEHNAKGWTRAPVHDMDAPVWSVSVHAGKTWPGNLATGASSTMADYIGRTPWWTSFSEEDASIKTAHPGAVAVVVETQARNFPNRLAQTQYRDKFFSLYGVLREFYTFTTPLTEQALALELHDTVQIKLPRFGLNSGKNMRIITQDIDCTRRQITFGVWG